MRRNVEPVVRTAPEASSSLAARTGHRRRRAALAAFVALLVSAVSMAPVRAERPRIYALSHATVVPAPGRSIESGTVVIRDGLIDAVGAEVAIPPDAVEIDASGLWIYPGLIDPETGLGLEVDGRETETPPGGAGSRHESPSGAAHPIARIHPERQARDGLVAFDNDDRRRRAKRHRELGFTVVNVVPDRGIFRGRSVAILLGDDTPVPKLIVRDDVAQHVAFESGRFGQGYPTSLMGAAAAIRQALLDTGHYMSWKERYSRNPQGMRRPDSVAAFEALAPVLSDAQTVVFSLESPGDFPLADRLADEFGLQAVMSGSGHEWEMAARIAAAGHSLILPLTIPDKPRVEDEDEALDASVRSMRRYMEAPAGPGKLYDAGVDFAFTTRGLRNLADFPRNLRKVIEAGLPEEAALAALTTIPARLIGVDAVTGTLEPGKIANVIVADGPLFDDDTRIQRVFVDGVEYRAEEKRKPKGDPDAVVDPRGEWSVVFEFGGQSVQRTWTITGKRDDYSGTAETRGGMVTFDSVELEGNSLTVVFPSRGGLGTFEITVIIEGETFDGVAEMGSRSTPVKGTRTRGPEGGA